MEEMRQVVSKAKKVQNMRKPQSAMWRKAMWSSYRYQGGKEMHALSWYSNMNELYFKWFLLWRQWEVTLTQKFEKKKEKKKKKKKSGRVRRPCSYHCYLIITTITFILAVN